MKMKLFVMAVVTLFLSIAAQAQSQPDVHKAKIRLTPEERTTRQLDRKEQLAKMTPAERKAVKQTHHDQRQARLNAMTPEQRARKTERQRVRKEVKQAGK